LDAVPTSTSTRRRMKMDKTDLMEACPTQYGITYTEADLKPCPFCDKKPRIVENTTSGITHMCDNGTIIMTKECKTIEEAVAAWNKRSEK
jgi:hypothetical protein